MRRESLTVQPDGSFVLALVVGDQTQLAQRRRPAGVVRAVALEQRQGPDVGGPAIVEAARIRRLPRTHPPQGPQHRVVQPGLGEQAVGHLQMLARQGVVQVARSVAGAVQPDLDLGRHEAPRVLLCQCQLARLQVVIALGLVELTVDARHRAEQLDAQRRLVLEFGIDARRRGIEQLACGDLAARLVGSDARVAGGEHLQQEGLDRVRAFGLGAREARLPGHDAGAGDQQQQCQRRDGRRRTLPAQGAADDVDPGAAARAHRPVQPMAFDVVGQRIDAGVALLGLFAQGLGHDRVQIALQRGRRHRRSGLLARHLARRGRRLLQHLLHGCRQRQAVDRMRRPAAQQLVQQQAQRVDIGRGRHRPGAELLGCGVARRQAQLARGLAGRAIEQPRDAEVQQLGPAFGGDAHVGRLQVPMHHQVAMRVRHRGADLAEQRQTLLQRVRRVGAPLGQADALDQLHHHVGPAIGRDVAVDEVRDARVVEPGHDLALDLEARQQRRHVGPHQFDGHMLLELAIGALGGVDLAHAAAADGRNDAPGPEPGAGAQACRRGRSHRPTQPLDQRRIQQRIVIVQPRRQFGQRS